MTQCRKICHRLLFARCQVPRELFLGCSKLSSLWSLLPLQNIAVKHRIVPLAYFFTNLSFRAGEDADGASGTDPWVPIDYLNTELRDFIFAVVHP